MEKAIRRFIEMGLAAAAVRLSCSTGSGQILFLAFWNSGDTTPNLGSSANFVRDIS